VFCMDPMFMLCPIGGMVGGIPAIVCPIGWLIGGIVGGICPMLAMDCPIAP